MAFNTKLIYCETKDLFLKQLDAELITDTSIVFIKSTGELWTHGKLFAGNFVSKDSNKIALTLGGSSVELSKAGHTHPYLPLSGGTLTGALNFANNTWNKLGDDAYIGDHNVGNHLCIKAISGTTAGIAFFNSSDGAIGKLASANNTLQWNGTNISLSNHNHDDRYVNVSGDTMTGVLTLGASSGIKGTSGSNMRIGLYIPQNIYLQTPGNLYYSSKSGTDHKIWHAGNDGSGSGLDADKLDGVHLNGIFTNFAYSLSKLTSTIGTVTKSVNVVGSYPNVSNVTMNTVASYGNSMGMASLTGTSTNVNPNGQTGWHHFINMSYNTESDNMWQSQIAIKAGTTEVWVRSRSGSTISDNSAWVAPWVRLARITDNVDSATKLLTARTLWGRSFDGTRNVSGNIENTQKIYSQSGLWLDLFGSAGVAFYTAGSLKGVFSSTGNFGIGTSSPSYKLHVNGNFKATDATVSSLFVNTGDPTLKIYSGKASDGDGKSDGNICFQTSIDATDGQTHEYPTHYQNRCNISLLPRGGLVYIGTNPSTGNTSYKLYVNGKVYSANGFVKANSSDSYLLLGGGGHKALSTLLTENDNRYVRYIKTSAATVGGTNSAPYIYNIENEDVGIGKGSYYYVLNMGHFSGGNHASQIAMPYLGNISDSEMYIRTANNSNWRAWRRVWHSGNFNPDTKVNKSGDTMTGILAIAGKYLVIKDVNQISKAAFGYDNNGAYIYNYSNKLYFGIKDDGTLHFNNYKIWHSGNDGSGSDLDADLLDNWHRTDFYRTYNGSKTYGCFFATGGTDNSWKKIFSLSVPTTGTYKSCTVKGTIYYAAGNHAQSYDTTIPFEIIFYLEGDSPSGHRATLYLPRYWTRDIIHVVKVSDYSYEILVRLENSYHQGYIYYQFWNYACTATGYNSLQTASSGTTICNLSNITTMVEDTAYTATKLGTTTIGNATTPIYLNGGTPTACSVSTSGNANTIAVRDGSGDLLCRLVRPTYANLTTISGALAFRINNSNDNYIRFCSDTAAIRTWLGVSSSSHSHTVFKNNVMIKGTNGISNSASIHLGIGDSDTGFKWISDGVVQMYANNVNIGLWNSSGMNWTKTPRVNDVAVALSNHNHDSAYLKVGDSATVGNNSKYLSFANNAGGIGGVMGDNDLWRIYGRSTASNAGYLEIATADDGNEPIYFRQYTGTFTTVKRTLTLLDGSGNSSFPGTVTASTFNAKTFAYNPSDNHNGLPWYGMTHYGNNVIAISGYGGIEFFTSAGNVLAIGTDNRVYANSYVANDWFRSEGNTGWYSQTYGGGWYMKDTTWVRVWSDKNIYTAGMVEANAGFMAYASYSDTNSASHKLDINNCAFRNTVEAYVNHNSSRSMLGWYDTVSGYGYRTRYVIGSERGNSSGWGKMYLAVGNNDSGTSIGCNLALQGNGWVIASGAIEASRFCSGYDSSLDNSFNCSNWFRSSGNTGWYNQTYGGGIYMTDNTWVRVYNDKAFFVPRDCQVNGTITSGTKVVAPTFVGDLLGNASNADKLDGYHESDFFRWRDYIASSSLNNFVERRSGTYSVGYSGYSGMLTVFHYGSGSVCGIEMLAPHYNITSNLKIRYNIDNNRFTEWRTFAYWEDCQSLVSDKIKWAMYKVTISPSSVSYSKMSGNHNFISGSSRLGTGRATLSLSYPSGASKTSIMMSATGHHRDNRWDYPIYASLQPDYGNSNQIKLMLADDPELNDGEAIITFMYVG